MIEEVNSHLKKKYNVREKHGILLAVSGGIDSMVMLHIFMQLPYKIEVAHINHSTREGESDEDQIFLSKYCKKHKVKFHTKILNYENLKIGNFQENARKERYEFLQHLLKKRKLNFIATAHHADDQWETFLMNLNRGSGLHGLKGIPAVNNNMIRPLIQFTKEDIERYQYKNQVPYVEDSSNYEDTYLRNRIRLHITPEIKKIFPLHIENVALSTSHLSDELSLLEELINDLRSSLIKDKDDHQHIKLKKIKSFNQQYNLLYYLLKPYGFNRQTVVDILNTDRTGAVFQSKDYEILHNRKTIIIREREQVVPKIDLEVSNYGTYETDFYNLKFSLVESVSVVEKHLLLDMSKIEFPVRIRNWKPGDVFRPAKMGGKKKKVKKFLTDLKLDRFAKEKILVLEKDDEILQILGYRTAEGYIAEKRGMIIKFLDD